MKRVGDVVKRVVYAGACMALVVLATGCGGARDEAEAPIPPRAAHYFNEAEEAYRAGAYPLALMLTDSVVVYAPEFSGVHVLRGQVYTALDRYEEASKVLARAAALEPDNPAIHFNWANNAYRREQYQEALERYKRTLEMIEEQEGAVTVYEGDADGRRARHAVLLQMGRAYDALGDVERARQRYEGAIELAPEQPEPYRDVAQLLEKQGAFREAQTYARQALERDPENVRYKYELGLLLVRLERFEEAVPYLKEVADEQPWHRGAPYNLGQALMHLGQEEEAEAYLARSDSLQKAHERLERLGKEAEANKEDLRLWAEYGNALRKAGRTGDAKKAYRHALSLRPDNIALHNNLAILAVESGDTTEAIMRYRAILRRNPAVTDVWLNLGVVYARSGRLEEAQRAWKNVLKYEPGHATARKYLAEHF